ncbi:MAG: hypothetical protein KDK37_17860, partial [Leptospiraceae bacterium]|nr:hypothetical protein [Leptospiraceae bacterium]
MKDQIQKIALLFLPIFLSSCFTYRSMESDEPVEPMENSPPLPAEVKIKADVHTNYNSALTSTVILILTYGFWPSVGSAESRIDYIATDQGGYSRRV